MKTEDTQKTPKSLEELTKPPTKDEVEAAKKNAQRYGLW